MSVIQAANDAQNVPDLFRQRAQVKSKRINVGTYSSLRQEIGESGLLRLNNVDDEDKVSGRDLRKSKNQEKERIHVTISSSLQQEICSQDSYDSERNGSGNPEDQVVSNDFEQRGDQSLREGVESSEEEDLDQIVDNVIAK